MKHQDSPEYQTRDIYLATVLHQGGIPLIRVESHTGRGIFIFEASSQIDTIIANYFNGKMKADPKSLFETWKTLKSLAYSKINNLR